MLNRIALGFSVGLFICIGFSLGANQWEASASVSEKFSNTDFETDLSGWPIGDANWWLSGGVDPSNAVAAYQSVGVASISVSKVNLAHPGTHDLTGVDPAWNATDGWIFNGTNQYLNTGLTDVEIGQLTGSFIVRYKDTLNGWGFIFFSENYDHQTFWDYLAIGVVQGLSVSFDQFAYGDSTNELMPMIGNSGGVLAMAGQKCFQNGVYKSDGYGSWDTAEMHIPAIYLGASHSLSNGSESVGSYFKGKLPAVAFYNTILTNSQVAAITTAMNTLSGNSSYRDTLVQYQGSGSAKINASSNFSFVQTVNVGDTKDYLLMGYAYTDGSEVTSSDVELFYNGSAVSTTYTDAGGGWYLLSAMIQGANENRQYGFQVKSGKTVYLDDVSLASDSTPPAGSVIINSGGLYTSSSQVTLSLSATDDMSEVTEMLLCNNEAFIGCTTWESYATTKTWSLTSGDGTKTVYAKFKDGPGNESSSVNDSIILDTTPPDFPVGEVGADNTIVPGTSITVHVPAPRFAGITEPHAHVMITIYSNPIVGEVDADAEGHWEWTPAQNIPEGTHRVVAIVTDLAGNVSQGEFTLLFDDGLADTGIEMISGICIGLVGIMGILWRVKRNEFV